MLKAYTFYRDLLLSDSHILIGGATGSGKSVLVNALIYHALMKDSTNLILLDPKKVELVQYRNIPHTIKYASEIPEMIEAMRMAVEIIERRYREMQKSWQRMYPGGHVYVIIDELADLMTTCKRQAEPLLQRICQLGRAAKVHAIMATQCPLSSVISTAIKCNADIRIGLRTACAQDSRNIIGVKGCEDLPDPRKAGKGFGIVRWNGDIQTWELPMMTDEELEMMIRDCMKFAKPKIETPKVEPKKRQKEPGFLAWLLNNMA